MTLPDIEWEEPPLVRIYYLSFVGKSVSRIYKRVLRRQLREAGMLPKRYRRSVHRAYRTLGVFP